MRKRKGRVRYFVSHCFDIGACPSARKSAVESSFVEPFSSLLCNFFGRKGKKGKKDGQTCWRWHRFSFFFNSISRGRRCELTLSFRTVVNIFVRRESIEKNNVSFLSLFSHSPVGFHVGRGAVRRGKLRLLSILLALSRINFNDR